jgi:hypothetical protein
MPYRVVKQYSDRGSIKDIQTTNKELDGEVSLEPTQQELRLKSLYENAMVMRDETMIETLGFIVMSGPANDPVAIIRHRAYVESIKAKFADQIKDAEQVASACFTNPSYIEAEMSNVSYRQKRSTEAVLRGAPMIKSASTRSVHMAASFWRAQ